MGWLVAKEIASGAALNQSSRVNILIAPDKFKGSLSAREAAESVAAGWLRKRAGDVLTLLPIADGGDGFADVVARATNAEWVSMTAHDPLGRNVPCQYAWLAAERLAILETSQACGLWRLTPETLNPLRANTFGVGQMIRHAMERGAKKVVAGLGGSATTDGGIGMAAALGFGFLRSDGRELEAMPENLKALARINPDSGVSPPEIVAACDVTNPLLGRQGTARIFAPQKGATPPMVQELENGLERLANVATADLGVDFRDWPGAGAAGGLGFGLLTFCKAKLASGFDIVADLIRLEERIRESDLVITGEGRLDSQTLSGKGPAGVARIARRFGKPVMALAGAADVEARKSGLFTSIYTLLEDAPSLDEAMRCPALWLQKTAGRAAVSL
ncbi:MAG TPA: glycerate kinase [Chthoniobacterales bacterium]